MDVTKLIAFLSDSALFFPRADQLGDAWEGAMSRVNVMLRPQVYKDLTPEQRSQLLPSLSLMFAKARQEIYISSWHHNDVESAAMWRLYLKSDEGIAVQTTVGRLKDSLEAYLVHSVLIGTVEYLDYDSTFIPEDNMFAPFLCKRRSFAHENEVRAIILDPASVSTGVRVAVSLETLIENVYLAPTTPDWILQAVQSLLDRFGISRTVLRSSLSESPVY
jgi:hypothetical protein